MGWLLFFSVVIIAIVIWVFKTNTITEYYDSGIVKLSGKTIYKMALEKELFDCK
jgi:hypothetical protein